MSDEAKYLTTRRRKEMRDAARKAKLEGSTWAVPRLGLVDDRGVTHFTVKAI